MSDFVSAITSYPTVLSSVLLGVALVYWLLVLLGAASGDALGADATPETGTLDVDASHTSAEGPEAASVHDAAAAMGLVGGLKRIPTTLAVTLIALPWWLANLIVAHYFGATLSGFAPLWAWGSLLLLISFLVAVLLASFLARPLIPLFVARTAARRSELVGTVVEVRTGSVDRRFGQAQAQNGGAGLLLEVRCDQERRLRRGDRAVIIAYDEARELYEVAPLDDLMTQQPSNGK